MLVSDSSGIYGTDKLQYHRFLDRIRGSKVLIVGRLKRWLLFVGCPCNFMSRLSWWSRKVCIFSRGWSESLVNSWFIEKVKRVAKKIREISLRLSFFLLLSFNAFALGFWVCQVTFIDQVIWGFRFHSIIR